MSGWGREDESSSSISTTSSSISRRREPEIDVFAVRNRIVDKIMAKKQKEEAEKAKDASIASASKRRSRVPLADLSQGPDDMELTQRPSTSADQGNLNWTLESTKRKSKIYSSTPLPGRPDPQRPSTSTPSFAVPKPRTPVKSKPRETSVIPEGDSEEEEPPPPPPAPAPKAPTQENKKRGRPKKDQTGSKAKPPTRQRPRSPTPEDEPLAFESSDEESPPVGQDPDSEQEAGPSTRQTSRVSVPKSPKRTPADRSRAAPPRSPATVPKEPAAKPSKGAKPPPAKPSKRTSAKPAPQPPAQSFAEPGPSTSRADGSSQAGPSGTSSRRKTTPKKSSAKERTKKLFNELRKLQNEPGFLIPRLPFMRVVRELCSNVAVENSNFKFTVDAMEALQTATEYYLTSVFTDAAALANHAKRVTVMPRDLDLLRKLRVLET